MNFGNPYPYMQMPQNPTSYLPQRPPMDFGSQMQTQPAQQGFIVRPVTSPEEARAIPTDFSGAVTLMPDLPHGVVYTKALNYNDGTSIFGCYRLDLQPAQPAQPEYVTRQEFEKLRAEIARMTEGAIKHDVSAAASDAAG